MTQGSSDFHRDRTAAKKKPQPRDSGRAISSYDLSRRRYAPKLMASSNAHTRVAKFRI